MPTARHIQPMGLLGRLEAIRAPTRGKARKGNRKMSTTLRPPVPQLAGGCTDRVRKYNTTVATNITSERAPDDQASRAAVRRLIPPTSLPCSLAPSVTTPLYTPSVPQALRQTLRGKGLSDIDPHHQPRGHCGAEVVEVGIQGYSPASVLMVNTPLKPSESHVV